MHVTSTANYYNIFNETSGMCPFFPSSEGIYENIQPCFIGEEVEKMQGIWCNFPPLYFNISMFRTTRVLSFF